MLLVSSPTCQISLGIKLLAQQIPGNANLLLTLSVTQSIVNVSEKYSSKFKVKQVLTFRSLSTFILDFLYRCIPVGMLHTQETLHFFANII